MEDGHLALVLQQEGQNQRHFGCISCEFHSIDAFESDSHVETRIREASCDVVLDGRMMGLIVVLEEVNAVILNWQVLELIPLRGLEALQALVVPELFAKELLSSILHLVLKLQFILSSHLHLYSLGSLLCLVVVALEVLVLPILLIILGGVFILHLFFFFLCNGFFLVGELESLDARKDVLVVVGFFL